MSAKLGALPGAHALRGLKEVLKVLNAALIGCKCVLQFSKGFRLVVLKRDRALSLGCLDRGTGKCRRRAGWSRRAWRYRLIRGGGGSASGGNAWLSGDLCGLWRAR